MATGGNPDALKLFCELSAVLTGEAAVAPTTAARHLQTLRTEPDADTVEKVLRHFRDLQKEGGDIVQTVKDRLIGDATLGPTAKKMVVLWFTGQIGGKLASGEDYLEALMWAAVGAHPPGWSDAYFGHWRYPPDVGV
jgi:hypothetical protein